MSATTYQRHRAAGRCGRCGASDPGGALCPPCAEESRRKCLERYHARKNGEAYKAQRRELRRKERSPALHYTPLDELMARPHVRILRALRWFDWATTEQIAIALDLPDHHENPQLRNAYTLAMRHMVQSGRVEANRTAWPHEYRLTPAGREWLRAALSVPGLENAATSTTGRENEKGAA